MKEINLIKHASKISFGIIISRILGYIRDMLIAITFGTSTCADAFYIAIKIPNLVRCLFGENSFAIAIIPVFSEYLKNNQRKEIQHFLNTVFTMLFLTLSLIAIIGIVFTPRLIKLIAIGFKNTSSKIALTITITKLIFPSIIFIGLSSFLLSILNVLNSFFIPAISTSMINILEIIYLLLVNFTLFCSNSNIKIKGLAISIVLGTLCYYTIQYLELRRLGWKLKFNLNLNDMGLKRVIYLMGPSILGASVDQINVFIDSNFASCLSQGAIAALYYSARLMQLPLSIFGISFANVLFPIMSKAVLDKDIQTFKDSLNYTLRMTNFTLFPASIGLMSIGLPLIKILFEHGNFTNMASVMTNQALFYYALGIPAFAGSKLLTNAFYSLHDTKIPIRIAIISMLLHIALCYFLINIMGIKGLALSTSISSYLNLIFLLLYLKIKIGELGLYKIIISASKSLFASIISGFIAWYTIKIKLLMNTSFILTVILSIILSFITFMSISLIIQNEELKNIIKYFHK